jgi:DnaK suppressor protein
MATMTRSVPSTRRARYERLERLLMRQHALLRARRQVLRQTAASEVTEVRDAEEQSVDLEETGVGFAVLELSSQAVQGMETALGRMKAGTYGTCADCDQRIDPIRLRAVAFAERCRECQERGESRALGGPKRPARTIDFKGRNL